MTHLSDVDPFLRQQAYYTEVAEHEEELHNIDQIEFSLLLLEGYLRRNKTNSLLDVGSGAGRGLSQLISSFPEVLIKGIEPSAALRAVAHKRYGIPESKLTDGNAYHLDCSDNSFDVVTEFAVLHHVQDPRKAVEEMVRVATNAVLLADTNNWGQGSLVSRLIKLSLRYTKLWNLYIQFSTNGKGYKFSQGDGVYYSFSLYDVVDLIRPKFPKIYFLNEDASQTIYCGLLQSAGLCVLATRD